MHHNPSRPTALLSLFILTLAASTTAQKAAQCFYPPNGQTLVPQPADTPCNPDAQASVCCAPEDICLSNGLCWRADINRLHRGSCTDPTFTSPSCTSICTGPNEHPFGFADVLECTPYSNENWYCGVGNSSKCNTDAAFKLSDGFFADYRNGTQDGDGGGQAQGKTVTVTQTVTQAECPLTTGTPVSAGQSGPTRGVQQGLTSSAGDGADVSSTRGAAAAANAVTTTVATTTMTPAAGNATGNATAPATFKPGNGAPPRRGVMSGSVLAGLGVLGVMLAM